MAITVRDAQRIAFKFLYENRTSNNLQLFTGSPNGGLVQLAASEGVAISHSDDFIVRQSLWGLISQGMAMLGSTSQGTSTPYITITEYGIKCYEAGTILPIDSEG